MKGGKPRSFVKALGVAAGVALLLPLSAQADVPEGFRSSYPLAKRAVKLSGVPGARVYCATSPAAWRRFVEENTSLSGYPNGLTNIATKEMFLPRYVCVPLEQRIRGKQPPWFDLGVALMVFGHESAHVRGTPGELAADRFACRNAATIAQSFGIRERAAIRRAVAVIRSQANC